MFTHVLQAYDQTLADFWEVNVGDQLEHPVVKPGDWATYLAELHPGTQIVMPRVEEVGSGG